MIDTKAIKDSEYLPIGVKKIKDGGLFIDVDIIKSFMFGFNCADIEYFDGTKITWHPIFEGKPGDICQDI